MIHITTTVVMLLGNVDFGNWSAALLLNSFFRWPTQVFIIISGFLLLNSSKVSNWREFYKRRLDKILIPLVFWLVFYYFFRYWLDGGTFSVFDFLSEVWTGGTYYHLYFLFLIAGLYLVSPFVARIKNILNKERLKYVGGLLLLLGFVYSVAFVWFGLPQLNYAVTLFIPYLGIYMYGFLFEKIKFDKKTFVLVLLGIVVFGFINWLMSKYLIIKLGFSDQGFYMLNRLSLVNILMAVGIFNLFRSIDLDKILTENTKKILRVLSDLCLGAYLIHPAILEIFLRVNVFKQNMMNQPVIWIGYSFLLTVLVSYGLVFVIKKIKILNRVV